jgi:hypothetical protein
VIHFNDHDEFDRLRKYLADPNVSPPSSNAQSG